MIQKRPQKNISQDLINQSNDASMRLSSARSTSVKGQQDVLNIIPERENPLRILQEKKLIYTSKSLFNCLSKSNLAASRKFFQKNGRSVRLVEPKNEYRFSMDGRAMNYPATKIRSDHSSNNYLCYLTNSEIVSFDDHARRLCT